MQTPTTQRSLLLQINLPSIVNGLSPGASSVIVQCDRPIRALRTTESCYVL